jgi:phosphoglucosamine mutase
MTPEIALKVGMVVGNKFTKGDHRHRVVIGKDTRLSGYVIEPALTAGFAAVGMDVFLVGPVPTPAVSMITRSLRADIGIMISASHNPYTDNGIKIFDSNGHKLSDQIEREIEEMLDQDMAQFYAKATDLGKVKRLENPRGRYIEFVKNSFPKNKSLNELKVVVDSANGAAYSIAGTILWELGAQVVEIGNEPNGFNINEGCGSTNTQLLKSKVLEEKADIGIALDGDADRLVVIDEKGNEVPGDILIALIAEKLHSEGNLSRDTVAITQMSNLALEKYLSYIGINTIRTNVGDRYVLEAMKKHKCNFGGEQSGHLVLGDYSTTGDGLVAALQILTAVSESKKTVSEMTNIFELMPQILINVKFNGKNPLENQKILDLIKQEEENLGDQGRVFVRKSGTEKLIRVMVEGEDAKKIKEIANKIAKEIE